MPKYRYQAADAEGKAATGELEAAGLEEARELLSARGFDGQHATLTEIAESSLGGRLSEKEAAEFGSQVAQLVKAGLPLAAGLRAMADEMPQRRVARALRRLASQLDAGTPLDAALEVQRKSFPAHLRGLIRAGVESGRLAEALEEFVDVEKGRIELRRRVWLALAYPVLLLFILYLLLAGLFTFVVPQFATIYEEFGMMLPPLTITVVWLSRSGIGLVVVLPALVAAAFIFLGSMRRVSWVQRTLYWVPVLGPMWRWVGLSNFCRMMALLTGQQLPLPRALRLTAAGLRETDLAAACREAADEIEGGRSLSECLADFWQFPPSLRPLVEWAERTSNPVAAFQAGTEMFEGRVRVFVPLLQTILPPVVFLLVFATVFLLVIVGLFMPLIDLISCLS